MRKHLLAHGIRFRSSQKIFQHEVLKDQDYLTKERQRFAFNLRHLKRTKCNLIYFDESSYNTYAVLGRAWGQHCEAY